VKVILGDRVVDERGVIQNLLELKDYGEAIRGVAIITSKAGSVRSCHYHKNDSHHLYVLSGSLEYFERAVGETEIPKPVVYRAGEMFWTGPQREHAVRFLEDTTLLSLSPRARNHESHESDVVRVKFL
jgi:quercetin dioxygenase-like cupin family protein